MQPDTGRLVGVEHEPRINARSKTNNSFTFNKTMRKFRAFMRAFRKGTGGQLGSFGK
jgi:hypothetical protein